MKIFGIGTDIVNIKRMKKTLKGKNNNFKKKIFLKMKLFIVKRKRTLLLFMQKDLLLKRH